MYAGYSSSRKQWHILCGLTKKPVLTDLWRRHDDVVFTTDLIKASDNVDCWVWWTLFTFLRVFCLFGFTLFYSVLLFCSFLQFIANHIKTGLGNGWRPCFGSGGGILTCSNNPHGGYYIPVPRAKSKKKPKRVKLSSPTYLWAVILRDDKISVKQQIMFDLQIDWVS